MPHSLEISWTDRFATEGGGTRLVVKMDGKTDHDEIYQRERLPEAREVAGRYLQNAKFDAVPPPPRSAV
jgi:hypothetical protein